METSYGVTRLETIMVTYGVCDQYNEYMIIILLPREPSYLPTLILGTEWI